MTKLNSFKVLFCVYLGMTIFSAKGSAQTPKDETIYRALPWSSGIDKNDPFGTADAAYRALEKANKELSLPAPTGMRDFYYQLIIKNNGFEKAPCGKLKEKRLINSVIATVAHRGDGANEPDEVQNHSLLVYGVGYDPVSQSRLDHDERRDCHVRPNATVAGKLLRYEGSSPNTLQEKYRGTLTFSYATEKNNNWQFILGILRAVLSVPDVKERIPAGYDASVKQVQDTIAAAGGDNKKTTRTTFRVFSISPAGSNLETNGIHELVINGSEPPKAGVRIYIRRSASLVMDKAIANKMFSATDIIDSNLRVAGETFREKFWETSKVKSDTQNKPEPQRQTQQIEESKDKLTEDSLRNASKDIEANKDFIVAFCKKITAVTKQLKLSNFDSSLMSRSMLIDYNLAGAVSKNDQLGKACWTQENEYVVQYVFASPEFVAKLDTFGSYAAQKP